LLAVLLAKVKSMRNEASEGIAVKPHGNWSEMGSQRWDLNPRPAVYETAALPLSYAGRYFHLKRYLTFRGEHITHHPHRQAACSQENRSV
jgi:hypothetical protein